MKKPQQYIVIDDDPTSNLICSFLLKKFDPEAAVTLFEDPGLALQTLLGNPERIYLDNEITVFLDLNMPLMSGWDFLEDMKKNRPDLLQHLEFYILSSSIEDFSKQRQLYPSLAGFLSKPLSKVHLEEIRDKGAGQFLEIQFSKN